MKLRRTKPTPGEYKPTIELQDIPLDTEDLPEEEQQEYLYIVPHPQPVRAFKALKLFFQNYINFSGRSSLSEFWWVILFHIILLSLTVLISLSMANSFPEGAAAIIIIFYIYMAVAIIPLLSLQVRRLHDIGKSGAWLLLSFFVIGVIILIPYYLRETELSTNRYGPIPNLPEEKPKENTEK